MRALMMIAAAATIVSCTRPATPPGSDFARETAGRIAGPARSCISTSQAQNLRVLDPQTLAYGWGRTIYVNRLRTPCPAVAQLNTIIVEPNLSGSYCNGDRIRGLEPGAIIAGPTCLLGDWVPFRMP